MYDGEGLLQRPKQPEINEHIREETAEIQPQQETHKVTTHRKPIIAQEGEYKGHYVAFDPEIGAVAFGTSNELMIQRELEFISRFPDECKQFYQEPEKKKIEPKTISAKPQTKSAEIQARTETPQTTLEIAISTQPVLQEETAELQEQSYRFCPRTSCQHNARLDQLSAETKFCDTCGTLTQEYTETNIQESRGKTTQREAPSKLETKAISSEGGIVLDSVKETAGVVGDVAGTIGRGLKTVGKGILKGTYYALHVPGAVLAIPTIGREIEKIFVENNRIFDKNGETKVSDAIAIAGVIIGNGVTYGITLINDSIPTKETFFAIAGANFVSGVGEIIRAGIRRTKTKRADLEAKLVEQYGTPAEFAEEFVRKFRTGKFYTELLEKEGLGLERKNELYARLINTLRNDHLVHSSTNGKSFVTAPRLVAGQTGTIQTYAKRLSEIIKTPNKNYAEAIIERMVDPEKWKMAFKVQLFMGSDETETVTFKFKKQGRNRKGEQLYELIPQIRPLIK